jgi:hypothetical protein
VQAVLREKSFALPEPEGQRHVAQANPHKGSFAFHGVDKAAKKAMVRRHITAFF